MRAHFHICWLILRTNRLGSAHQNPFTMLTGVKMSERTHLILTNRAGLSTLCRCSIRPKLEIEPMNPERAISVRMYVMYAVHDVLVRRVRRSRPRSAKSIGSRTGMNRCGICAECGRRPGWTSRSPDPKGRESATPFLCWLCVHICLYLRVCPQRRAVSRSRPEGCKDLVILRGGELAAQFRRWVLRSRPRSFIF